MNGLLQDLRHAFRQMRRAPGFSATVVLTLALGLGASSAIFCLIDGLWLHPMPVSHQGDLVRVFATTEQDQEGYFSYSEYQALAQRATALRGLTAIGRRGSLMPRSDGTSSLLLTNVVSENFFDLLGVHPFLGRVFTAHDAERLRAHPGVLLSYSCWQRNFSSDPNIVGRQIPLRHGKDQINQVDVWGVLPPEFREVDPNSDRDLWMPAETWAAVVDPGELTSPGSRWFNLLGRLASNATVAEANNQAATVAAALEAGDPANNKGRGARAVSDFGYRMSQAGTGGLVLFAIVGCVALLATVNVAHLLLARALTRGPEVALRLSLGARRRVVARQLLVENLLLNALGFVAGLGLATGLAALLPHLMVSDPAMLNAFPSGADFHLDWRGFLFAGLVALITTLLLALVPLAQVARPQLLPLLQSGSGMRTTGRTPAIRRAAIWLQIAISFALIVSTGALVRSFLNTRTQSIGLTRNQVLFAWTQEPDAPLRESVLANLRALPGVQNAAYAIRTPLMPSEGGIAVKALLPSHPELRDPIEIKFNAVSPGFLDVTGTRIVRGRGFIEADNADAPLTVLVNRTMAQKYWSGQEPIGQVVRLTDGDVDARVVGITEDAPIVQIGEIPEPFLYIPFQQYKAHLSNMGEVTFVLGTGQNAMSIAQEARRVLIHANPLLDPMMVSSLPELIRYSAGSYQMMAELVSALGFIGLALTVVGLYGFMAFRVTQRRREIGIRMALGASREGTALLILRDTSRMAAVGLLFGLGLSLAAMRLETSVLFGVRPLDALSIAVAFCVLSVAISAAAWLPARRAASIDPIQALRTE